MPTEVQIVDSHTSSNLRSVINALEFKGLNSRVVERPDEVRSNSPLLIPGVGTFSRAMDNLSNAALVDRLREHGGHAAPLVGICLGMQILFDLGLEGGPTKGIGFFEGAVTQLPSLDGGTGTLNIGYQTLTSEDVKFGLMGFRAYFAHSYIVVPEHPGIEIASASVGGRFFTAAVQSDGVRGVQFHPELSGAAGASLLSNLLND